MVAQERNFRITWLSDAYFAGWLTEHKSTSGTYYFLGNCLVFGVVKSKLVEPLTNE